MLKNGLILIKFDKNASLTLYHFVGLYLPSCFYNKKHVHFLRDKMTVLEYLYILSVYFTIDFLCLIFDMLIKNSELL